MCDRLVLVSIIAILLLELSIKLSRRQVAQAEMQSLLVVGGLQKEPICALASAKFSYSFK